MTSCGMFVGLVLLTMPTDWSVGDAHGPAVVYERHLIEGTWISLDVHPAGTHLAFDLLGHIYEMPIGGGEAKVIVNGRAWSMFPRYSPDGGRIAFTSDRGGSNDLWVMDRDGSGLRNVSDDTRPVFQGTWSRDGRALVGTALDAKVRFPVYRYHLDGGRQELIPGIDRSPPNHFEEHPDGAHLYFEHNDGRLPANGPQIKTWDLETGEIETVVGRPGGAANPCLSPDGSRLAYVHRDDQRMVLVVRELESGVERVVLTGLDRGRFESRGFYGCYPNMDWHPDGRRVFLSFGGGIHWVDVDSGESRSIPFGVSARRELDQTMRFEVPIPEGTSRTRSHRWAQRTKEGIVFETLGDLWLRRPDGELTNLTNTPEYETSPSYDPVRNALVWATWSDEALGGVRAGVFVDGQLEPFDADWDLPPSQYGSVFAAPEEGAYFAALAGSRGIRRGEHVEDQSTFDLWVFDGITGMHGGNGIVTEVSGSRNRYARRPPFVKVVPNDDSPEQSVVYFTEFEDDVLLLKRIERDGEGERTLYRFPNATRAILSPDLRWIAFREYHRSFVTPFDFVGKVVTVSPEGGHGVSHRVDLEDGDFMTWSADSETLGWTRGRFFYEKALDDILEARAIVQRTDLSMEFELDEPESTIALTGVDVLTMNARREVLEDATILVERNEITAVGSDVDVPAGAEIFDLAGRTVMPGMFDAHGHYGSRISTLNVIEQRHWGLLANLAYGVTTMFDVYGTTQKDFWLSDMLRRGDHVGPRIFSVGDPIFVTKYRTKMHRPIHSLDDALEHARFNADHGAVALKDYSNHGRAARQQLAVACRREGLNLVTESFGDPQMNLTQLVDGFTGIEHTMGLTPLYEDVVSLFAATQVGMTPTLVVLYNGPAGERYFHERERLWEDPKLLRFFRADELIRLRRPTHHFDDDYYHPEMVRELKKLHDAGVLLQMGAHGQMMGLGAHWEMELFVHGGFSPLEAIEVATINGFTHHGLDHALGSIEPGKLADLVVLRADPREDIRNTRSIELVMKNGRLYDGDDASQVFPDETAWAPMYFQDR